MKNKVEESKKLEAKVSGLEAQLEESNITVTRLMDELSKLKEKYPDSVEECLMLWDPKVDKLKQKLQLPAIADRTRSKRPDVNSANVI